MWYSNFYSRTKKVLNSGINLKPITFYKHIALLQQFKTIQKKTKMTVGHVVFYFQFALL